MTTTTHTMTSPARVLLVNNTTEAHALDCTHEGVHLGTMSAKPGVDYKFTGDLGACLKPKTIQPPVQDCLHPWGGMGEDNRCPDCDARVGWGRLPLMSAGGGPVMNTLDRLLLKATPAILVAVAIVTALAAVLAVTRPA